MHIVRIPSDSVACGSLSPAHSYLVKDFSTSKAPSPMRTKYRLPGASTAPPAPGKKPPPMRMQYSPLIRNAVFFSIDREVLLFDIDVYQVTAVTVWCPADPFAQLLSSTNTSERARSPIIQLLIRDEPDRFVTLHEDGAYATLVPARASLSALSQTLSV